MLVDELKAMTLNAIAPQFKQEWQTIVNTLHTYAAKGESSCSIKELSAVSIARLKQEGITVAVKKHGYVLSW